MGEQNPIVPKHYGGLACQEAIDKLHSLGLHSTFELGNAIKYLWRAGDKVGPDEIPETARNRDYLKAMWYLGRYMENISDGIVIEAPSIQRAGLFGIFDRLVEEMAQHNLRIVAEQLAGRHEDNKHDWAIHCIALCITALACPKNAQGVIAWVDPTFCTKNFPLHLLTEDVHVGDKTLSIDHKAVIVWALLAYDVMVAPVEQSKD